MTDVFEITPDTLREINRIFHRAGKYSALKSSKTCINSYINPNTQKIPECCNDAVTYQEKDHGFNSVGGFDFMGEDRVISKWKREYNLKNNAFGGVDVQSSEESLPLSNYVETLEYLKIQNIEVEKVNSDYSSSSSLPNDYFSSANNFFEKFKTSRVSSVTFDSHEEADREFPVCMDFMDAAPNSSRHFNTDDDDECSEIVDFIKNFRFGEETVKTQDDFGRITKEDSVRTKGVFVDLFRPDTGETIERESTEGLDSISVNSDDSASLRDINVNIMNECDQKVDSDTSRSHILTRQDSISSLPKHCASGELLDAVIEKRRNVLRELRTAYPLIFLYLTFKMECADVQITGKLSKYKSFLDSIDNDFITTVEKYNLKLSGKTEKEASAKEKINHRFWLYNEIFNKSNVFFEEIYFMALQYPFIRHLVIRESFQEAGANLSFFLLQFIENDRANLLYSHPEGLDFDKITDSIHDFLREFRRDKKFKSYLHDVIVVHYTENKEFFSLENLLKRDINWEEVAHPSRTIQPAENADDSIAIIFKDSILKVIFYIINFHLSKL